MAELDFVSVSLAHCHLTSCDVLLKPLLLMIVASGVPMGKAVAVR